MPTQKIEQVFPADQIGELTLNAVANFNIGEVVTGGTSGATAIVKRKKVRKVGGSDVNIMQVNKIVGVFEDAEIVSGADSGQSATVQTDGFDLSFTASGVAKKVVVGVRSKLEILRAVRSMAAKITDSIAVPTFTAAVTYSGTSSMVTGDTMTITVTASEAVKVIGSAPAINVTINGVVRKANYTTAGSTATEKKFVYTVVAGDVATAGQVVVGTAVVNGAVQDIPTSGDYELTKEIAVAFSAPDTSATTVN